MSRDLGSRGHHPDPGGLPLLTPRVLLSWPSLLLLGWLVYELSGQAPLTVAPWCLKFAWADLATAFWLRRKDPRPRRGLAYFWLFLAWGLWKAATLGLVVLTVVGVVQAVLEAGAGPPQPGVPAELVEGLVIAYLGFGACCVATAFALRLAHRGGFRVWVDSAWHRARREDRWPVPAAACRRNVAGRLVLTALLVFSVGLLLLPLVLAGLLFLLQEFPPNQGVTWPYVVFGLVLFALVGVPAIKGSVLLYNWAMNHLVADCPEEGWDPDDSCDRGGEG
jgi:hypothetical protein